MESHPRNLRTGMPWILQEQATIRRGATSGEKERVWAKRRVEKGNRQGRCHRGGGVQRCVKLTGKGVASQRAKEQPM